jgi:hypothetical protein
MSACTSAVMGACPPQQQVRILHLLHQASTSTEPGSVSSAVGNHERWLASMCQPARSALVLKAQVIWILQCCSVSIATRVVVGETVRAHAYVLLQLLPCKQAFSFHLPRRLLLTDRLSVQFSYTAPLTQNVYVINKGKLQVCTLPLTLYLFWCRHGCNIKLFTQSCLA